MAHLYSDENFPLPVVSELRQLGHDVLTLQESGHAGKSFSDREVLDFAIHQNRTVLTLNRRHFIRLHHENSSHRGIIVCTVDPDFVGQVRRIDSHVRQHQSLDGLLLRVNRQ